MHVRMHCPTRLPSPPPQPTHARTPARTRAGTWVQGCCYLVATVGAPFLLSLPASFAALGWAGGTCTVVVSYLAVLWSATRLAHLHELGGVRRTRYRDLGVAVLGPRWGGICVTGLQLAINTGMCTIYPVVCGQALLGLYTAACAAARGGDGASCSTLLSPWIAAFAGAQLFLVVLPDFASLAGVQVFGALTTLGFSFLAVLGSLMHGAAPGGGGFGSWARARRSACKPWQARPAQARAGAVPARHRATRSAPCFPPNVRAQPPAPTSQHHTNNPTHTDARSRQAGTRTCRTA